MPEPRSDKQGTVKLRFRAVFAEEALGTDVLEAAERLFARWAIRALGARESEPSIPAQHGTPGPQHGEADGATDPRPSISATGARG